MVFLRERERVRGREGEGEGCGRVLCVKEIACLIVKRS
jgi:hypothetical protein